MRALATALAALLTVSATPAVAQYYAPESARYAA